MELAKQQTPTEWFPEGRDPWRDLYNAKVLEELGAILKESKDNALDLLGVRLCGLAERYVTLAEEVELEKTQKWRATWIQNNFITPAKVLFDALDFKNERFSSKWPDEEIPDYARLGSWRKEIKDIIAWANDKKSWLLERPRPRVKPATDYRYALVWDLLEIYVAVTGRKPKRASYNRRSKESQIHGEFPQFIRKAATPLIGRHVNLDHQIQLAKQKFSEMKKNKGPGPK
jgi:hypothetical protein